jgi:hypothetical protein
MKATYEEFARLINNYTILKNQTIREKVVQAIFDRIKFYDDIDVKTGIESMIEDSEEKVTDNLVKQYVRAAKQHRLARDNKSDAYWNGTPCSYCEEGIVYFSKKLEGRNYKFIAKCPKCDSFNAQAIPYFSSAEYSLGNYGDIELENKLLEADLNRLPF